MPQMFRLSQGHWLNLDTILEVCEQHETLVVATTVVCPDAHGDLVPLTLYLTGEERTSLLVWLEQHSQVWRIAAPANDDEPPF